MSDYGRDRDRDRHRHKERSRDRRDGHPEASRDGERKRSRSRERKPEISAPTGATADAEQEKKKQRLAKLAAWKSKQGAAAAQEDAKPPVPEPKVEPKEEPKAWKPWEDPAAAFTASEPKEQPPPRMTPIELPTFTVARFLPCRGTKNHTQGQHLLRLASTHPAVRSIVLKFCELDIDDYFVQDDGIDPLDAFMASEINPEVRAKEAAEAKKREEELKERAKQRAEGKIPKLEKLLEDSSDEEEEPDAEVQVPEHKVKLIVGPGGEKIKLIQRKSKCRLQIKKSEDELKKGFLEKRSYALPKARKPGDEVKMVTIMLFGNAKECDIATRMIDEAVENREQKQKQREREYERKRDAKSRDRQLYHLRHTNDYETLGIPIGSSKADAKRAFRELAKKWHPDKHPVNKEEANKKFQEIQRAYESLMSTDEDARIEALTH